MRHRSALASLVLICLLAISTGQTTHAQNDSPKLNPSLRFSHLTSDDGLAQNSIKAILQDKQGFIWIGTQGGLSRYDGYRFTNYKHSFNNSNSLSKDYINHLYEDRDGMIWIATEGGGIDKFDPRAETFTHFPFDPQNPEGLGGDRFYAILQDSNGIFWFIGTPQQAGLTKFNPATQTFSRYLVGANFPANFPTNIGSLQNMIEVNGSLWITAARMLVRLDLHTEQFTPYPLPLAEEDRLDPIHKDTAGNLWLGGLRGIYKFDLQQNRFTDYYSSPARASAMLEDASGNFWVTTREGLHLFDPRNGQIISSYHYDSSNVEGLNAEILSSIYQDRGGVLWIATEQAGLNLLDLRQTRFTRYRHNPATQSISSGIVTAIHGDDKRVWLGVGNIVNEITLATNQIKQYALERPNDDTSSAIAAIYKDRSRKLWIGTSRAELYELDVATGKFTPYPLPANNLPTAALPPPPPGAPPPRPGAAPSSPPAIPLQQGPPKTIVGLYEDDQSALWIAVNDNGLYRFDPERKNLQYYASAAPLLPGNVAIAPPPDAPRPPLTNLYGDSSGTIWVSTYSGVNSFDIRTRQFTVHTSNATGITPDLRTEAFYKDQKGILWIASREGLLRYDVNAPSGSALKRYTEEDGLSSNFVVGILADRNGNLWLSTKKGISRFTPSAESKKQFRNYDAADGLQGNEFSDHAFWQAPDGQMFFGGINGVTAFYPEQIKDNLYQPPVVFTDFQLFNKRVSPGPTPLLTKPIWATDQLTVNYDQNVLTFEFAALGYAAPNKNRYRYKLEGFEKDWNETRSDRRFASYTALPAGDYVLRVQATNEDGVWSEHEASLKLSVTPPLWETTWFRVVIALLFIGTVAGAFRWRTYSIRERNRQLEEQVSERTRQLQESESNLRQAKDLAEAANRAKSTFLANMSHELRTPLNAILGFTQIINRQRNLPNDVQENLGVIMRSGEHLLTLINQVLDLSKIEAGRITLNEKDFDLHRLLSDVEGMFTLKADDHRLRLVFIKSADLPKYIRTDEVKLRQVLINLINNALKFTEEGGVTVRAKMIGASKSSVQNREGVTSSGISRRGNPESLSTLQFEVEDTGNGIAPEEMNLLFEAFAQTESGRQAKEGTGLGLPISRKFVQLMGGDITVNSRMGHGTTFAFDIQVQRVDSLDEQKTIARRHVLALEPDQPTYRILVVDDIDNNRQLLVKLFEPLGFEIREAGNGQEAVNLCESFKPHLIWMDMRMPVMDGLEATRRIKLTPQGKATVIIALTASSLEEERSIILEAGCDEFMRKPFRDEDIFELMQRRLGVRFVYEEYEAETATQADREKLSTEELTADIKSLSPEIRQRLIESIELGDIQLIDQALADVETRSPALAEEMTRLAHQFDYDMLLSWLQEAKK